jgi:CheY-like chemotaxis protein
MTRILLADNSPHAQRMGERILREEGFEVVTVTDGQTALVRLADVDPDVVLADVSLPGRSGYDICREVKTAPGLRHIRVVLTAGLLDHFDDGLAVSVRCDGVLKKPFEASATMEAIRPLIAAAQADRAERMAQPEAQDVPVLPVRVVSDSVPAPARTDPDAERIRAAVTLALDAALPEMINQITQKVLIALRS